MNFANINTQEIKSALATTLILADKTITGADITHWAQLGWRKVTVVDAPTAGYRVTQYGVQEIDGLTCRLTVVAEVDIAAEQAANAAVAIAARQEWAKSQIVIEGELRELTAAILETVFELIVPQINTLRQAHGLPAINQAQVISTGKSTFKDNYDGKIDTWT